MQVIKDQLADSVRRIAGEQALLQANERYRQVSRDRRTQHTSGVAAQAGRDIDRGDGQPTDVDRVDCSHIGLTHIATQARAEQGVQQHATQFGFVGPCFKRHAHRHGLGMGNGSVALQATRLAHRQHSHRPAGTAGQGRHQKSIAGVIAVPGHHGQLTGLWPAPDDRPPGGTGGALHQFEAGGTCRDQLCVEGPDLRGTVQRVGKIIFSVRHASSGSDVWQNYTHLSSGFSRHMPATSTDLPALAQSIKDWGRELGFQQVGISGLDLAEHEQHLQRWLEAGYHGEMDYMGAHGSKRSHPEELVPGTLRVVSLRMDYLPGDTQMAQMLGQPEKAYVSRYALGRDYHKLIRKRVQQLAEKIQAVIGPFGYRAFVDSAPVLEKAIAEQAGLGWIGKNTLVLNRKAGSYFFLSELFVDLPLPVDPPHATEHCGKCTACLDICPTNAFVGPYQLDARRCISYLTIELKNAIPEELRPLIGNRVFGCDDCQIVCPWNRFARPSGESDFKPRHNLDNAGLAELFLWDEDTFLKSTEGSPLRRAGYERWLRNLAVGLGNAPSTIPVLQALQARRDHPSQLVREHVEWALRQHNGRQTSSL